MRRFLFLAVFAALVPMYSVIGCSSSEGDGRSAADVKKSEEINSMAKNSGGDWSKLSPDQQALMVKETGSEGTAKQVLQMKAHPPAPVAPGRPSQPGP